MATDTVLRAEIVLDVSKAISAYTEARQAHVSMVTALNTGAGALTSTGLAVASVGAGIAAGLIVAANAAGEFERKLDFFGAVADSSIKDMEGIREKALQLGADSIYSADQVADSFVELAKAGVKAEGIMTGIGEAVVNLGAAADIPLTEAANSLTTVLNIFKISAEDAVGVVDQLTGSAASSNIEVGDLLNTLSYAGAAAAVAGISFEDVNVAVAYLGKNGVVASKAGTGLRRLFERLLSPTNAGADALRELGVVSEELGNQLLTSEGTLKTLPEVLDILNASLEGMKPNEKIDILGKIFPITSMPTILTLLQGGSAALGELNKEIDKTSAADIAAKRLDNLSGDVEYLRGEFQTLTINIGQAQQALARGLVQAVEAVVAWLNRLSPEALGVIVLIAQLTAVALILFGGLTILAGGLLKIIGLIYILHDALPFILRVIGAITGAFGRLWAVMLGPAGTVIALIAAIVTVLILFFTKTEAGKAAWAEIVAIFSESFATIAPLVRDLVDAFQQMGAVLVPLFAQIATIIAGVLIQALTALVPIFIVIAQAIASTLVVALQFLVPLLTGLVQVLTGPLGGAILAIVGVIAAIVVAVKIWTAVMWLLDIAMRANFIGIIITLIVALVAAIIWVATQTTFFQDLWANLASFFTTVWTAVSQFFITIWTNLVSFFMGIWNGIVAFLTPIFTVIYNVVKFYIEAWINTFLFFAAVLVTVWNAIVAAVQWAWGLIWDFIGPTVTAIVNFIIDVINNFMLGWGIVWGAISSFFTDVWNNMMNFLIPIVVNIMSFIVGTINTIQGIWNSIWGAISSFFNGIWQGFIGAVQGPVNTIFGIVGGIQDTIIGFFTGVGTWLLGIGEDLIQGLINGITNMIDGVIGAVGDVVNGAIDWAKNVLNMNSPSKVFRDIGINTILGMIIGVEKTAPALNRTMDIVASSVDSFYDQVYAAREFDVMMNLESQMGIDAYSATQANQLSMLNEKLSEIAEKDTINIEEYITNNPEPEPASDTLPNNIRKATYLVGG